MKYLVEKVALRRGFLPLLSSSFLFIPLMFLTDLRPYLVVTRKIKGRSVGNLQKQMAFPNSGYEVAQLVEALHYKS